MKRLLSRVLLFAACVAAQAVAQPPEPSAAARFKQRYPEIRQSHSTANLRNVAADSEEAAAARSSQKVWFLRVPAIADSAPALRLVEVGEAGAVRYYLVSQTGFGGGVVQVFGPLDI